MEKAEKAFGEDVKIYSPMKERQIRFPNSEQKSLLLRPVDNWIELSAFEKCAWLYTTTAADRLYTQVVEIMALSEFKMWPKIV